MLIHMETERNHQQSTILKVTNQQHTVHAYNVHWHPVTKPFNMLTMLMTVANKIYKKNCIYAGKYFQRNLACISQQSCNIWVQRSSILLKQWQITSGEGRTFFSDTLYSKLLCYLWVNTSINSIDYRLQYILIYLYSTQWNNSRIPWWGQTGSSGSVQPRQMSWSVCTLSMMESFLWQSIQTSPVLRGPGLIQQDARTRHASGSLCLDLSRSSQHHKRRTNKFQQLALLPSIWSSLSL